MNLRLVIDGIFEHLVSMQRPVASKRIPGIDSVKLIGIFHKLNLTCPPELLDLYEYCGGTITRQGDILDDIHFFPGYYWMSFEDSIATYQSILRDKAWNKSWFPVFASGGGDFYAVVCNKESSDFGSVVGFLLGTPDTLVEFKNTLSFMETIKKSYDEKAFFLKDGYLEADYPAMRKIAQAIQPDFIEHDA